VSGNASTYNLAYDAFGRCVKRTLNGSTVYYTYDGPHPIYEWKADGTKAGWNVYGQGIDEILLRADYTVISGGQGYFFQQNRLGSVTHLTGFAGEPIESYRYDTFGMANTYTLGNFNNRFRFTGREHQPSFGIYEYRNRAYHPGLGRFLSEDPSGFGAGDSNLFRYCGGDPVNRRDPFGLVTQNSDAPGTDLKNDGTNSGTPPGYTAVTPDGRYYKPTIDNFGPDSTGTTDRIIAQIPTGPLIGPWGERIVNGALNVGPNDHGTGAGPERGGDRAILGGNVTATGLPVPTSNDLFHSKGKQVAGLTTLALVPNQNGTVTLIVNSLVDQKILDKHHDLMNLEKEHVDLAEFWVREMNRTGRHPSALMKKFGNSPWDLATAEQIQAFLYESAYPELLADENRLDRDGGPHDRPDFSK
jgi:RHS repeat-associated protein